MVIRSFLSNNKEIKQVQLFNYKTGNLIFDGTRQELLSSRYKTKIVQALQTSFTSENAILYI